MFGYVVQLWWQKPTMYNESWPSLTQDQDAWKRDICPAVVLYCRYLHIKAVKGSADKSENLQFDML